MPTAPQPGTGLRERKKIRTRQAIRRAAYRLFEERGFEATRVDEIAAAADVSPSTVFRYFPTKEDIVLSDEEDPIVEAALRARPAGEPPLASLREALRQTIEQLYASPEAPEEIARRMRLIATVPSIRARLHESVADTSGMLTRVLAERTGRRPEDLEIRVFMGAVLGGLTEAMLHVAEHHAEVDVVDVLDRALTVLQNGLAD
ncbi:acyl-CoA-like ligand-binding transcription factor [Streptomyces hainanensis]|nr:TetR family transcriptional regulator [Streptomyces hainanensis]